MQSVSQKSQVISEKSASTTCDFGLVTYDCCTCTFALNIPMLHMKAKSFFGVMGPIQFVPTLSGWRMLKLGIAILEIQPDSCEGTFA